MICSIINVEIILLATKYITKHSDLVT